MIVSPLNAPKMSAKRLRNALVTGSALFCLFGAGQLWAFSLDDVAAEAKTLAEQKYQAPRSNLPKEFRDMKFADYQKIQFNRDKAQWAGDKTPFKLSFYHQGMHFDTPVKINEVTATTVEEIKYDPSRFDFGDVKFDPKATENLGWAGFRVLYPINKADKQDEIMTMLGASYFRVVGKGQIYGLSARGMAIDTALPSGEEFPRFTEFWIEKPKPNDKHLVIFALLDSPRATGAYRFTLRPGVDTVVDVKAQMFLRDKVGKLGIAPLTSMYLFGANQPSKVLNYRRELHDSSGLAIHAGNGEWICRPLNNPQKLQFNAFVDKNPKGFGLLQLGARFYEGKIGLFKQTDSVSDLYFSTYVYAKNRPTRVVDPDGRQALVYPKLVPSPSCGEVCGGGHAITMAQKYVEQIVDELSLGRCPPTITVNCFENRRCSHKGRVECGKSLPNSGSGASMKINFAPPCADPMCLILHELVHTCGMTAHGWYGTIRIAPCGGVGFGK